MLTLIPFDDDRVVGARISGKITRPEFDAVAEALEWRPLVVSPWMPFSRT